MQVDINHEYMVKSELFFADNLEKHWSVRLGKLLPCLTPLLITLKRMEFLAKISVNKLIKDMPENPRFWFMTHVKEIVQARLADPPHRRVALLTLMLDSTPDDPIDVRLSTFPAITTCITRLLSGSRAGRCSFPSPASWGDDQQRV